MKATEIKLKDFLTVKKQFVVPIYQRKYSWGIAQCQKLWEDIERICKDDDIRTYFIGSIVRVRSQYCTDEVPQEIIIDGQQRITTVSLLILALIEKEQDEYTKGMWVEDYLTNKSKDKNLKYKLKLTEQDNQSFIDIVENKDVLKKSKRIAENYEFFLSKLTNVDASEIMGRGIYKLSIVDIQLDAEYDNPQLIFESLNSTGLELSQADLIRNYILMSLDNKTQTKLYEHYWRVMEENFGQENYNEHFNRFVRDYLTIKNGDIPNIKNVYNTFKEFFEKEKIGKSIEDIVQQMYTYSNYYTNIALNKEEDKELRILFKELVNDLKTHVSMPFLLVVYNKYKQSELTKESFKEILQILQSYIFRRSVCNLPTNALNKIFATMHSKIDENNYLDSFKALLIATKRYNFPNDTEFANNIKVKDFYNFKNRLFLFSKLENRNRREEVNINEYTVEHIMPQSENMPQEWIDDLGPEWQDIHDKYLHTIGNLTLTKYNSKLSNKSFKEKQTNAEYGYNTSPLHISKNLRDASIWNEDEILKRIEDMSRRMVDVWQYPDAKQETINLIKRKNSKTDYSRDDHAYICGGKMGDLFNEISSRIKNIDPSIEEVYQKSYIAYKNITNFADIDPTASKLNISIKHDYKKLRDPEGRCRDVSNIGHRGNGNFQISVSKKDEIDYLIDIIKQSFDYTNE